MKSNEVLLRHIQDEISFLLKHTQSIGFDEFVKNDLLKRASARSLEIIGEAVKNISADFRKKYNNVDWTGIAGMRDRLIHQYFGVNWNILWNVIKEKLPELEEQVESILNIEKEKK